MSGENTFADEGVIRTPGFPLRYRENLDCKISVVALSGSQIDVNITVLDLQYGSNCETDKVEVSFQTVSLSVFVLFETRQRKQVKRSVFFGVPVIVVKWLQYNVVEMLVIGV